MIGQTPLHYNITKLLGKGGMGEVYLAEDTKLKRQVALKVLPATLRDDKERLQRFRQEAEAVAKLKHPNIATVYALEEADGVLFIAMEYIDGTPLYELIPETGLDFDPFFTWFIPLSDAVSHAHRHGVYHRDLKPGNVIISADGVPKILDFGLARIDRERTADETVIALNSMEPTRSLQDANTILGTPAYMSPEQATGKRGDQQSDIFSFGVMMYEAMSGQRPFTGDHHVSVISSVLKDEPSPVTLLKPQIPYTLGRIIKHSLQKDRADRYESMRDVYRDLKDARTEWAEGIVIGKKTEQKTASGSFWQRPSSSWLAMVLILLTVIAAWWVIGRQPALPDLPIRKFQIQLDNMAPGGTAISPDGSMIAYINDKRLWVRRMDQLEGREIPGTEGASGIFWSPGGNAIGYRVRSTLWRVAPDGGNRIRLCELPQGRILGITWGSQDMITFSRSIFRSAELWSVADRGGDIQTFAIPEIGDQEWGAVTPRYLPDGRTLVYAVWIQGDSTAAANMAERYRREEELRFYISSAQIVSSEIVVHSPENGRRTLNITGDYLSVAGYAPTGHLLYYRGGPPGEGDLWAVPFSPSTGTLEGNPFPVVQNVNAVSVSGDGIMTYRSSTRPPQQLAWVDRRGRFDSLIGQPQDEISDPSLSPDGTRVVVEGTEDGVQDLWIHNVETGVKTRLTYLRENASSPTWTPDGEQIVFENGSRRLFRESVFLSIGAEGGGTPQSLTADSLSGSSPHWSLDSRYLVYNSGRDIWYVDFRGDPTPRLYLKSNGYAGNPTLSSDNRYLAYETYESGRFEVFVGRFPSGEGKWQISAEGGRLPRWSGTGDELFYIEESNNTLMSVPILDMRTSFRIGRPVPIFEGRQIQAVRLGWEGYDISPDRQRFIVVQNVGEIRPMLTIVENWMKEYKDQ